MKGGFCNMKTLPIDASLRKIVSVQRNNLQRKSILKNLNGGGALGGFPSQNDNSWRNEL